PGPGGAAGRAPRRGGGRSRARAGAGRAPPGAARGGSPSRTIATCCRRSSTRRAGRRHPGRPREETGRRPGARAGPRPEGCWSWARSPRRARSPPRSPPPGARERPSAPAPAGALTRPRGAWRRPQPPQPSRAGAARGPARAPAWSALRAVLLARAALVAGGVVAAITIVASPQDVVPLALAYGAGGLVAFYGLGPGSSGSRRPLRRFYDTVAATPLTATVAVIVVTAVVCGAALVAAAHAPVFWPFSNTGHWVAHFTWVRDLVHNTRTYILKLVGK